MPKESPESRHNRAYHEYYDAKEAGDPKAKKKAKQEMDSAAAAATGGELLASIALVGFASALAGVIIGGVRRR